MYLDHFGLHEAPFKITPHTDFFYQGANRGATLEGLMYAILNGEGLIKIVGEVGSGKTMLSRVTIERLPENVQSILITTPSINPDEVLLTIAEELGLDISGLRLTNTIRSLQECLIEKYAKGMQVVLFIDEAHAMPRETLEEIRLLSNLESSRNKLLQIVLFGQPELDDLLSRPEMRQLRERITHSFNLSPLSEEDIRQYLAFRMRAAGYKGPDIFSPAAVKQLTKASQGLTRRINILADKALLAAFADNTHGITAQHAQAAINDSEFSRIQKEKPHLRWLLAGLAAGLITAGAAYLLLAPSTSPSTPLQTAIQPDIKNNDASSPPAASSKKVTVSPEKAVTLPKSMDKTTSPSPEPAATKSTTTSRTSANVNNRLQATQALLESDRNAYTIQLMLADPPPSPMLDRLLAQPLLQTGEPIQIFPTSSNGQKHLAITYGLYKTKEEAKQAMIALPPELARSGPILRTLKGIREETRSTQ